LTQVGRYSGSSSAIKRPGAAFEVVSDALGPKGIAGSANEPVGLFRVRDVA
jgi:hypothetical protein